MYNLNRNFLTGGGKALNDRFARNEAEVEPNFSRSELGAALNSDARKEKLLELGLNEDTISELLLYYSKKNVLT